MLVIDKNNNIFLTRGDTLTLKCTPKVKGTNPPEDYEPQEGDTFRFAISKGYEGEFYIKETASSWDQYSKLWKKTTSGWAEVDPYDELDTTKEYRLIEV